MDSVALLDVVKRVEIYVQKCQPEIIYTHFQNDLNIDHSVVARAVLTACRPVPGQSVKEILFFEVLSSTEWDFSNASRPFAPNCFIDITDTLELKLDSLNCYQSEMREFPHARSVKTVKALAQYRGATIGVDAAESFVVGMSIR